MEKLEIAFAGIDNLYTKVEKTLSIAWGKHAALQDVYKQLCNMKSDMIGNLDIYNFQMKIIMMNIQHGETMFQCVCNRMYMQYYKSYTDIQNFYKKYEINMVVNDTTMFPEYDFLDSKKVYDFQIMRNLHAYICILLKQIVLHIEGLIEETGRYQKLNDAGIFIDTFLHACNHKVHVMKDDYKLCFDQVAFHNNIHTKCLEKALYSIEYTDSQIACDISMKDLIPPRHVEVEVEEATNVEADIYSDPQSI
jgi:hypothetical protein